MAIVTRIINNKRGVLWTAIIILYLYLMLSGVSALIIDNRKLNYNSLIEQISHDNVMQILDRQQKFAWLGYVMIPIMLAVKLLLVSFTLSVGEVFYDIKLTFKKAFQAALFAEPVFIVMSIVKLLWIKLFVQNLTLEYIQSFVPLSLSNLFNPHTLNKLLIYPLQTLNLFEVAYFLMLIYNVSTITGCKAEKATSFVLITYGIGLLLWIVIVSFLILNFVA